MDVNAIIVFCVWYIIFIFLQGISKKGLKKVPKPAVKGLKKTVKDKKLAKITPKVTERDLKRKAKNK